MFKILVGEIESEFAQDIAKTFAPPEFLVQCAPDALELIRCAKAELYHAILLDRRITKANAFEMCRGLRSECSEAAIMILHAEDSTEEELAINHGADQCLSHPVQLRDLSARLRALLRRRWAHAQAKQLSCHDLLLNLETGILTKDERKIDLRPMEFILLEFLMRNQGKVFSSADLWREVWKRKGPPSESVRAHIAMLRKKIGDENSSIIKTIVRRGYKIEPTPSFITYQ